MTIYRNATNTFEHALQQPTLTAAVADTIQAFVKDGGFQSPRELQHFLPRLLHRAFGDKAEPGWLEKIPSNKDPSYTSFYGTFHPSSALFQSLLSHANVQAPGPQDPSFTIDMEALPEALQVAVKQGQLVHLSAFFQARLVFPQFQRKAGSFMSTQTAASSSSNDIHLRLHPVEYYLLCFISTWPTICERTAKKGQAFDPTHLYTTLLEAYLYYLLPIQSPHTPVADKYARNLMHSLVDSIFTSTAVRVHGTLDQRNLLAAHLSDTLISLMVACWLSRAPGASAASPASGMAAPSSAPAPCPPVPNGRAQALLTVMQHLAVIGLFDGPSPALGQKPAYFLGNLRIKAYHAIRRPLFAFLAAFMVGASYSSQSHHPAHVFDIWLAYIQPWRVQRKLLAVMMGRDSQSSYGEVPADQIGFIAENAVFFAPMFAMFLRHCHKHAISLFYTGQDHLETAVPLGLHHVHRVLSVFFHTKYLAQLVLTDLDQLVSKQVASMAPGGLGGLAPGFGGLVGGLPSASSSVSLSSSMTDVRASASNGAPCLTKEAMQTVRSCVLEMAPIAPLPSLSSERPLVQDLVAKVHTAMLLLKDTNEQAQADQHANWLSRLSDRLLALGPSDGPRPGLDRSHLRLTFLSDVELMLLDLFHFSLDEIQLDGVPVTALEKGRLRPGIAIYADLDARSHIAMTEPSRQLIKLGKRKCTNRDIDPRFFTSPDVIGSREVAWLVKLLRVVEDALDGLLQEELWPAWEARVCRLPVFIKTAHISLRWMAHYVFVALILALSLYATLWSGAS